MTPMERHLRNWESQAHQGWEDSYWAFILNPPGGVLRVLSKGVLRIRTSDEFEILAYWPKVFSLEDLPLPHEGFLVRLSHPMDAWMLSIHLGLPILSGGPEVETLLWEEDGQHSPALSPPLGIVEVFGVILGAPVGQSCKAIQYSDQMVCEECKLCWDINDPDPPSCQLPNNPEDPS